MPPPAQVLIPDSGTASRQQRASSTCMVAQTVCGNVRWGLTCAERGDSRGEPEEVGLDYTLSIVNLRLFPFAGLLFFDDLYCFDPANMTWTLLSAATNGAALPSARYSHGFTSAGGKLYVHGGNGNSGNGFARM
jgi:hypothetical protein